MRARSVAPYVLGGPVQPPSRVPRRPHHSWFVKFEPYQITPICIAPVLPGETLDKFTFQSRTITEPLKSKMLGWWCNTAWFFVGLSMLEDASYAQDLFLSPSNTMASATHYQSSTRDAFYYWASAAATTRTGYNWLKACMRPIIETYFRDEGEAWTAVTIGGYPACYIGTENWAQSFTLDSEYDAAGVDVTIPIDATPTPDVAMASDVARALYQYQMLQQLGLQEITYEDILRSYGVSVPETGDERPELLRFSQQWTYPTSTVTPSSATAGAADISSACVWSLRESANKRRFFREPGFIIGATYVRPKIYMSKQNSFAASLLDDLYAFAPAMLRHEVKATWKKITDAATDILGGYASGDWWLDVKDLYLHGDQFVNFDIAAATDANTMAIPSTGGVTKHPIEASVDAMFVSASSVNGVLQDGIAGFTILGSQVETSPRGSIGGSSPF